MPAKLLLALLLMFAIPVMAQEVVKQGAWETIDYDVQGVWKIVRAGDTYAVQLGEDFETKNGPDLHILLSPRPINEIDHGDASNDALVVGLLKTTDTSTFFKKMKGPQSLPLPSGVKLSEYRTILIHCVQFSHLWAGGTL